VIYLFTADQLLQMIEHGIIPDEVDVELWNGVIYKMTKGAGHNYTVAATGEALRGVVPPGYHVREEKSGRYGRYNLPEPDVMVVRGPASAFKRQHPQLSDVALVVEVCHHSPEQDCGKKSGWYAEAGIPVYWVINIAARAVDVFSRPEKGDAGTSYAIRVTVAEGGELVIVVDGRELGRVAVADLLP
jgi:Uma2 family endonuclease